jgi:hypothetical protein
VVGKKIPHGAAHEADVAGVWIGKIFCVIEVRSHVNGLSGAYLIRLEQLSLLDQGISHLLASA